MGILTLKNFRELQDVTECLENLVPEVSEVFQEQRETKVSLPLQETSRKETKESLDWTA